MNVALTNLHIEGYNLVACTLQPISSTSAVGYLEKAHDTVFPNTIPTNNLHAFHMMNKQRTPHFTSNSSIFRAKSDRYGVEWNFRMIGGVIACSMLI